MARTRQPRRHLLSVIRQKVSPPKNKHNERGAHIQGGSPPWPPPTGAALCGEKPNLRAPSDTPAPGFRDGGYNQGYGVLWYVGYGGYCWSSTGSGAYARFLYFNYGFLARQTNKTPGGRGFQLRCLQVPLGTRTGLCLP